MTKLRIGSLASGIGGDAVAWHPLGWEAAFFAEIEPFACAVLAHRFDAPNLGDFTAPDFAERALALGEVDVLAAGTPCQAFSVAGKRGSLKDDRGNLTLRFVEVVHELDPAIVVWENVPGVLSTDDNAFGCFLAGMVGASEPLASGLDGGRWPNAGMVVGPRRSLAWRVLDAQYIGLAQRRRRVCVVSLRARDRTNPGAVLFEPESLRGDPPPRREEGEGITGALAGCSQGSGHRIGGDEAATGQIVAAPITASEGRTYDHAGANKAGVHNLIYQCHGSNVGPMGGLRSGNANESGGVPFTIFSHNSCGTKRHAKRTDISVPIDSQGGVWPGQGGTVIAFSSKDHGADAGETAPTLRAMAHDKSHANAGGQVAVAFDTTQITSAENHANPQPGGPSPTLAKGGHAPALAFTERTRSKGRSLEAQGDLAYALTNPGAGGRTDSRQIMDPGARVRRLTPRECERLQGFPDDYTLVPYRGRPPERCADGPRYRALGNAWAAPVFRWIGHRIEKVLEAREAVKS